MNVWSIHVINIFSGSEFRLYGCLVEHCEKADLSYPQRITATALRKYMATVTQVSISILITLIQSIFLVHGEPAGAINPPHVNV